MKCIAFSLGWLAFWLGHLFSLLIGYNNRLDQIAYEPYNWLMHKSLILSDKYDLGIWERKMNKITNN